jgi:hypothetical protein
MKLQEHIRRILREETNIRPVLMNLLNLLFDGFNNIDYDWAEYNCGMGVCCDPYAIGFVLPQNEYNEYLFKLVDGKNYDVYGDYSEDISDELPEVCYESPNLKNPDFDTIVIYEELEEGIENYIGSKDKWIYDFIDIINEKFGCEAKRIIFI